VQDIEFRQLVESLKLRSPIEEVVSARVEGLKRRGALWWARCPFHDERTPSFAVDPRRATWRCYGACGEGGDVIGFLERFDGVGFLDALRLLARAAGIELPDDAFRARRAPHEDEARRERLLACLARAQVFYARELRARTGGPALTYARERGLSEETLEAFGLGWADGGGQALLDAARASGVSFEDLRAVGLARESESGHAYDFFRARLMIPIRDRVGHVVGFGGRLLPGDEREGGKYVNTAETELFKKGRLIFGLDRAERDVRRTRHMIVVEGYTDVMAAHQAGFSQVVAVLGTATTDEHAALVRRAGAERVTLLFDGDEAGRRASEKALLGLIGLGITIDVVRIPGGADPCDLLVRPAGPQRLRELLAGARDWYAWSLEDLEGSSGPRLAQEVDRLFGLVARLAKPVERDLRLIELARALGLSEASVREQWAEFLSRTRAGEPQRTDGARLARKASASEAHGSAQAALAGDPRLRQAYGKLISALIADNSLVSLYEPLLEGCPEACDERDLLNAFLTLYRSSSDATPIDAARLLTFLEDHPARSRLVTLQELARTADESPQSLAAKEAQFLERRELELRNQELETARRHSVPEDEALLKTLHAGMRATRVPTTQTVPGA
jgi:DNA primase